MLKSNKKRRKPQKVKTKFYNNREPTYQMNCAVQRPPLCDETRIGEKYYAQNLPFITHGGAKDRPLILTGLYHDFGQLMAVQGIWSTTAYGNGKTYTGDIIVTEENMDLFGSNMSERIRTDAIITLPNTTDYFSRNARILGSIELQGLVSIAAGRFHSLLSDPELKHYNCLPDGIDPEWTYQGLFFQSIHPEEILSGKIPPDVPQKDSQDGSLLSVCRLSDRPLSLRFGDTLQQADMIAITEWTRQYSERERAQGRHVFLPEPGIWPNWKGYAEVRAQTVQESPALTLG